MVVARPTLIADDGEFHYAVLGPHAATESGKSNAKSESANVEAAISQSIAQGLVWLINGPASILDEPVPSGVLSASATLRPPPEVIAVGELMAESIPDAWKDGKTNALAIAIALSEVSNKL
jgi:hypothetical protein